jgi:hypothetical protein
LHKKFLSGNIGTVTSDNVHIVYVGDLSSPADMKGTCREMHAHRKAWERFNCKCICRILENLEFNVCLFVFLEIQVYY